METFALVSSLVVFAAIVVRTIVRLKLRLMQTPPPRIQLVPVADPKVGRYAESHRRDLQVLGFEPLGVYRVPQMRGVILTAFAQPSESVCAIVYSHPAVGVFFDVACMTTADVGVAVTTAPAGENLDRPPGRNKIYERRYSVRQAYERLLAERPNGPYRSVDAANFARVVAEEYAREMDWRMKRGGVTEEEVRREAQAMHITSEATIQQATRTLQEQYAASSRERD